MSSVIVIAEAGVNHNGDMRLARKLIEAAADAGADYVKFQTFVASELLTSDAPKAEYQQETTSTDESQREMIERLELSESDHHELIAHCQNCGIKFFSTAFNPTSIRLLRELDLDFFKIPSGEINNVPYLREIGRLNRPVIMSTGMATLAEIEFAIGTLADAGTARERITVLHCNTEYPTPMQDVNLLAMNTIRDAFKIDVGYSDHTVGIEIPVAAVALGATVIEKHFTLDRTLPGPDHAASLEPDELAAMVSSIRNIEVAMGDGVKRPSASELANMTSARKRIVASVKIKKGETYCPSNITTKRSESGISAGAWDFVIGKIANRDFLPDEAVEW